MMVIERHTIDTEHPMYETTDNRRSSIVGFMVVTFSLSSVELVTSTNTEKLVKCLLRHLTVELSINSAVIPSDTQLPDDDEL